MTQNADFVFTELGGQCMLKPLTTPARKWMVENIGPDVPYIGISAIVPWGAIGLVLEAIDKSGLIVVQARA